MRTRGKRKLTFLLTGLSCLALLAASCGSKRQTARRGAAPAPTPDASRLSPLPARPLTPRLAALRERLMRTTAAARELAWDAEPGMTELTNWEYGARTKELADVLAGDELRALSRLAGAGGVLPEGIDLATLAAGFTAASASATYSPFDKRVLLIAPGRKKGAPAQSPDESLLTHEFVHALQDQHFDLLRLLVVRPYNFDRTEALFALVEGDATNVQRRLEHGEAWARRPLEELARAEDARFGEYRRGIGAFFPPLLTETFIFRYRDGLRFVEAVRRRGGARAVDELFKHPPASSEQVLHPEKYFAGELPREVRLNEDAFTAAGWDLTTATPLGEIGVRGLLMRGHTAQDAARAAAGWGGDRACLFERRGQAPLFVWRTAWDRPEDAADFFRAYGRLHERTGARLLEGGADARQAVWDDGARVTIVRLNGDHVLILRGAAGEVQEAVKFTSE